MFLWIRTLASRISARMSRREVDQDFDRELESHLDMLTQENLRRGMAPEEAARAARVRLGGATQLKETNRELHGLPILEEFLQDARYGFRALRKNPGFTAVAVLTLALGVGANTAIFSVVDAILLKPLSYPHSEQLLTVFLEREHDPSVQTGWSYPNFAELREQNHVFSEMGGVAHHHLTVTGHGEPTQVSASAVTAELFSMFGTKPLAGRVFSSADGIPGAEPVVILSESLWLGMFRGDPQVIGSSIQVEKRAFTVVGIMPQEFRFPMLANSEQLWLPVAQDPHFGSWVQDRGRHLLLVTGRLKPGVTAAEAQPELEAINARLTREFPGENSGWAIRTIPLQELFVGDVRPALVMLSCAVGLVLLIACANIASLLLARATARSREIAVRVTLGAGRARIVRQLLSETVVLGAWGGAAGIALAYWGVHGLSAMLARSLPQVHEIRVDSSVLGFALALSAIASLVFGLAPAFFAANSGLHASLREGGARAGESAAGRRARSVLAAAEIALAMVLLVAAGLLLRSYSKLMASDTGFTPDHVLKANISLPRAQYQTPQQWQAFGDELLSRLRAEPGMQDSALVVPTPIADHWINLRLDIVGAPLLTAGSSRMANYVAVSPEYFRVMGIRLIRGRTFDARDSMPAARVTLISQALARIYFPHEDPLGKQLRFTFPPDSDAQRETIAAIRAPTLVITGAKDPVTPPAEGRFLAERIPGAQYAEIGGAHLCNLESPEPFNSHLIRFLAA